MCTLCPHTLIHELTPSVLACCFVAKLTNHIIITLTLSLTHTVSQVQDRSEPASNSLHSTIHHRPTFSRDSSRRPAGASMDGHRVGSTTDEDTACPAHSPTSTVLPPTSPSTPTHHCSAATLSLGHQVAQNHTTAQPELHTEAAGDIPPGGWRLSGHVTIGGWSLFGHVT